MVAHWSDALGVRIIQLYTTVVHLEHSGLPFVIQLLSRILPPCN